MINAFDTHCHLTSADYDADRDRLIANFAADGVGPVVVPGYDLASSSQAAALAAQHTAVYFAPGVHPSDAAQVTAQGLVELERLAALPKCVAIGEIGLDYHYDNTDRALQQQAFELQLQLAAKLSLPVIIHMREATEDTMAMLTRCMPKIPGGVMHCFSGSLQTARQAIALGMYISFAGTVTFKNAKRLQETAAALPLDKLLIETDAPYLAPHPHRGQRNQPALVRLVAEQLAQLHAVSLDEVCRITAGNAARLFRLKNG